MRDHLRRHIVGYLALFVALGGTSYAATLPRNSVGANQIKTGAVGSSEVKDRTLLAKDFKAGQLPAGARGATGLPGAAGPQGAAGATGPQGPAGPTEGTATDNAPATTPTNVYKRDPTTVTTTRAGRLLVLKSLMIKVTCGGANPEAYLVLDGERVPGSITRVPSDGQNDTTTLAGVTAGVVPAGQHTVEVAGRCQTAGSVGIAVWEQAAASVVVLG